MPLSRELLARGPPAHVLPMLRHLMLRHLMLRRPAPLLCAPGLLVREVRLLLECPLKLRVLPARWRLVQRVLTPGPCRES